jgi:formylglycine-generating enzyme required for sulfatase activity
VILRNSRFHFLQSISHPGAFIRFVLTLLWSFSLSTSGQEVSVEWEIILRDQTTQLGRLENANLILHSRIGIVTIPIEEIREISFRSNSQAYDQVKTRHRNLISGLIHEPFRMTTVDGEPLLYLPSSIDRLQAHASKTLGESEFTNQYLILRSGDMISGSLVTESIQFQATGREESKEINSIESIRLKNYPEKVELLYRDGHQETGTLNVESFVFHLDTGSKLVVSPWEIDIVYCRRGFTPVSVNRLFDNETKTTSEEDTPVAPFENFVWMTPGSFTMGSESNESGRGSDEGPQTAVTITQGFWMSQYEVTQSEYIETIGSNPSTFTKDPQQPVEKVNWHEAVAYCRQLTTEAREADSLPQGYIFRLPTEAEWEYACRAGTSTRFSYGDDPSDSELGELAWYVENSNSSPHPVGQLKPNPWGLYDMHGNVWEWCYDKWQYAYPGGKSKDFLASEDGWLRVARGGSWLYSASNCRSANRDDYGPNNRCSDIGFRVVLAPPLRH